MNLCSYKKKKEKKNSRATRPCFNDWMENYNRHSRLSSGELQNPMQWQQVHSNMILATGAAVALP